MSTPEELLGRNNVFYDGVSIISGTGAAICTTVVVAQCNGR
jgi:hypothetical protein